MTFLGWDLHSVFSDDCTSNRWFLRYSLAETKGNVEAVLFWNFSIKLPHGGHASVSAAAVHTPALDGLQIGSGNKL